VVGLGFQPLGAGWLSRRKKLRAIHEKTPLDLLVLLKLYEEEMDHVVIDPRRLRGNFLGVVAELFPDAAVLVGNAFEDADQRNRLDAYLAA
jgi:hypothetical protein